jgi:chemotaxis protein CheZ
MSDPSLLAERLAAVRARHPQASDGISEALRAVMETVAGGVPATEGSLLGEVEALGRTIATAKAEIAALHVDDITASHIPSATDELDAIVAHTATATHDILAACEALDGLTGRLGGDAAASLLEATTRIYEACSFQDITGQRITKVVGALKEIESKVAEITLRFGCRRMRPAWQTDGTPQAMETLLNGPQHPAVAMGQSDIDKLLASFD